MGYTLWVHAQNRLSRIDIQNHILLCKAKVTFRQIPDWDSFIGNKIWGFKEYPCRDDEKLFVQIFFKKKKFYQKRIFHLAWSFENFIIFPEWNYSLLYLSFVRNIEAVLHALELQSDRTLKVPNPDSHHKDIKTKVSQDLKVVKALYYSTFVRSPFIERGMLCRNWMGSYRDITFVFIVQSNHINIMQKYSLSTNFYKSLWFIFTKL
jgi:hypothetical protein